MNTVLYLVQPVHMAVTAHLFVTARTMLCVLPWMAHVLVKQVGMEWIALLTALEGAGVLDVISPASVRMEAPAML